MRVGAELAADTTRGHDGSPPSDQVLSGWRWAAVLLAMASVVAHLPVIQEHVRDAPYMGVLFAVYCLAALVAAAALLLAEQRSRYVLLAAVTAAAALTYVLTRLVAFPQLAGDVGHWGDPYGLAALTAEVAAATACVLALRRAPRAHPEDFA